jgi:amino acid transporter
MTIDWVAFLLVFAVATVSACLVVLCFATAIRLLAMPPHGAASEGSARDEEMDEVVHGTRPLPATVGAVALFAVSGLVVLLGVYLIVPALHP